MNETHWTSDETQMTQRETALELLAQAKEREAKKGFMPIRVDKKTVVLIEKPKYLKLMTGLSQSL